MEIYSQPNMYERNKALLATIARILTLSNSQLLQNFGCDSVVG